MTKVPLDTTGELSLDPLSTLTMTYTEDGFNELKNDIARNGQLVPILLRDGCILDGRHRYKACKELGTAVHCTEVGLLSDNEALDVVISNSINKATGTDAAKVEAYLMCKAKGIKQKDMPTLFNRLNSNYIRKLSYIEKQDPEYLNVLLRQNSVRLFSKEFGKLEDCGTINGIWRVLKVNSKLASQLVEITPESTQAVAYDVYIDQIMPNVQAEQEFWGVYEAAKASNTPFSPASPFGRLIIDYILKKHTDDK